METRTGYFFEDLELGMSAHLEKVLSSEDVFAYADLTGDHNPVHVDEAYAAETMFKGRIAHGMLTAGLISAVLGMRLPGPGAIYLSQSLKFRAPVRCGDLVRAEVTVKDLQPRGHRVSFDTVCRVGDKMVLDGEALVMVPSRG